MTEEDLRKANNFRMVMLLANRGCCSTPVLKKIAEELNHREIKQNNSSILPFIPFLSHPMLW